MVKKILLQETNTVASKPDSTNNPKLNGFYHEATKFKTELEAQRKMNLETAENWKITNPNSKNFVGEPVAYELVPGENSIPFFTKSQV